MSGLVHVEAVLTDSDFDPDVFANDTEKAPGSSGGHAPGQPSPTSYSDLMEGGVSVVKKDANWDFADISRPPIYEVDVTVSKGSMGSSDSMDTLPK